MIRVCRHRGLPSDYGDLEGGARVAGDRTRDFGGKRSLTGDGAIQCFDKDYSGGGGVFGADKV